MIDIEIRKVYLAGPMGFAESWTAYREELHQGLEALGFTVIDPFDFDTQGPLTRDVALAIGARNFQCIDTADLVLAVLDGQEVDSGTATEIGYARARWTPVFGLRSDTRLSGEVAELRVNLQVATAIIETGGRILRSIEELPALTEVLVRRAAKAA